MWLTDGNDATTFWDAVATASANKTFGARVQFAASFLICVKICDNMKKYVENREGMHGKNLIKCFPCLICPEHNILTYRLEPTSPKPEIHIPVTFIYLELFRHFIFYKIIQINAIKLQNKFQLLAGKSKKKFPSKSRQKKHMFHVHWWDSSDFFQVPEHT